MPNILVLGGSGFVGRAVCEKLVDHFGGAGPRIIVPSRRPGRARRLWLLPTVEVTAADVHSDADLARLVSRCDCVINLVGILHGSEAAFDRVHAQLPRRVAQACAAANVNRVIHVSAIGADSRAPSRYLRSKAAGEAALSTKGLDLTILRPSVMFGDGDSFLTTFARLQAFFPVIPLASSDARFQPVWVEDVASAVVRCLGDRTTIGEVIECCGPEVYTLRQLMQLAGRASGNARPVLALPAGLGRLQASVMECLPGEPLMSRDNLDSMRVANVASGEHPGLARLGIQASALEAIAPLYLGEGRGPARLDSWREATHRH